MGAGADDEIARLRARAYGPDADIATDPRAAARLRELETAVRSPAASGSDTPPPARPTVARESLRPRANPSVEAARREGFTHGRSDSRGARARRADAPARPGRGHRTAVAIVATAGLVLGAGAAVQAATDAAPVVVAQLAADPDAADFVADASTGEPPLFPIAESMQWTAPLGEVLGWDVWIGRSRSNFACLALVRSLTVRADCVSATDFRASGATIFLPPGSISPDLRPAELTGGAALAYEWTPDRTVTVEVRR